MGRPKRMKKTADYGVDFKLKAVALSEQEDVLIKDVAESLDVHPNMLSKWRKEHRDGVLKGDAKIELGVTAAVPVGGEVALVPRHAKGRFRNLQHEEIEVCVGRQALDADVHDFDGSRRSHPHSGAGIR